jgi:hypothetical protein
MFINSLDNKLSVKLVFDIPFVQLGQRYTSVKDVQKLFEFYELDPVIFGVKFENNQFYIPKYSDLLLFSKCLLAMALLRDKQNTFIKKEMNRALEKQKELKRLKLDNQSKLDQAKAPGPIPKSNRLNMAMQQISQCEPTIDSESIKRVVEKLSSCKKDNKIKSTDEIQIEVQDKYRALCELADWMYPKNINELYEWMEVQLDIFDQAMGNNTYTDIDILDCMMHLAKKGKEEIQFISVKDIGGFHVLPKELQKMGYEIGVSK